MNCINCGAPLEPKRQYCTFCGTLNDTDLRGISAYTKKGPPSERICPRCDINLQTVDLSVGGRFLVERCDKCLGIFFDPGELEALLDKAVTHIYEVDFARMRVLTEEEGMIDSWPVAYVKCPICGELMHRKGYGARSGVIVDTCKNHGVWLDGGELGKLLRWTKAGGLLHDEARKVERAHEQERRRRAAFRAEHHHSHYGADPNLASDDDASFLGLLGAVVRMLRY
jgi:Zn-finger nucleic acid-binding protein